MRATSLFRLDDLDTQTRFGKDVEPSGKVARSANHVTVSEIDRLRNRLPPRLFVCFIFAPRHSCADRSVRRSRAIIRRSLQFLVEIVPRARRVYRQHRGDGGSGMAWSVFTSSRVPRAPSDSAICSFSNG